MPDQTEQNTADIAEIKTDIKTIKENHLYHIERDLTIQSSDMRRLTKQLEKIDMRLWGILILLVGSVVIGVITNGL